MLNQVQLIGFTGAEADIRATQAGETVALLRVAISRYSRKDGEKKDDRTCCTVEIWTPATVSWLTAKPLPTGAKASFKAKSATTATPTANSRSGFSRRRRSPARATTERP